MWSPFGVGTAFRSGDARDQCVVHFGASLGIQNLWGFVGACQSHLISRRKALETCAKEKSGMCTIFEDDCNNQDYVSKGAEGSIGRTSWRLVDTSAGSSNCRARSLDPAKNNQETSGRCLGYRVTLVEAEHHLFSSVTLGGATQIQKRIFCLM